MKTSQQFSKITSYQSSNFKKWFGDMSFEKGKVLTDSIKLPRAMNDEEILAEIKPTEVSLGEVYATLEMVGHSDWYLFYVKDKSGVLRTVRVCWRVDGWSVRAFPVDDPGRWDVGRRVFSRNSVLESSAPRHLETLTL